MTKHAPSQRIIMGSQDTKDNKEFEILDDFDPKISTNLNWGELIRWQINRILILQSTCNWERFIESVQALDATLDPYKHKSWIKKFNEQIRNMNQRYLTLSPKQQMDNQNQFEVDKAKMHYKMLCNLCTSVGIFPTKSIY